MPNDETMTAERLRPARPDTFALYPPRSAVGLDPSRADSFAERLAALHRHHGSLDDRRGKGGLFILDIGELRRRFANRWPKHRENAYQLIEGCLERRLGRHDLYLAKADDRFLLLMTDTDRTAAERHARRIGQEITDRLCGMIPGGVACRVETTTIDLTVLLAGGALAQELTPRAYWPAPKGTRVGTLGIAITDGDVVPDPSLPITGLDSSIRTYVAGYLQTIDLFGRTANVVFEVPYSEGTTLAAVPGLGTLERNYRGLGDIAATLSVNLLGAPSMMKAMAPATDSGTDTRMISGSRQLSNCAASTR